MSIAAATAATWRALELEWEGGVINAEPSGWKDVGFDDSAWPAAIVPVDPPGSWYDIPGADFILSEARLNDRISGAIFIARREFAVAERPATARLVATADNWADFYLDGTLIGSIVPDGFTEPQVFTVDPALLTVGTHCLSVLVTNETAANDWTNPLMVQARLDSTMAVGWDVYAADDLLGNPIATLEHAKGRYIRSELHGLGEGGFVINRHAAEATEAILAEGNMVKARIEDCGPDYIDGFFLPGEGDYTLLSVRGGKGGANLSYRGPGALAYLDRARMTQCAFSIEDTLTGTWTELWKTKNVGQPVGAAFDPAEPGFVYVGSGAARKVRKVDQSTREVVSSSPALWSGTTKYLGGISFDPDDSAILWALEIPWLAGSTANTKIRKVRRSDWAILDTFDLGSALKLTDIRVDGDFIWTSRYDNNVIQQRSKATGAVVDSSTITFRGKVQQKPNGIAINLTSGKIAYWFGGTSGGGTGRALLADTSDPWTITGVQKTTGISAFGGEWYSDGGDQFLIAVSYTEGRTWKYQLTDAVAACADDSGTFHPEQTSPGALAWRILTEITHPDRPSQPCPELSFDFSESADSNGTPWPARTSTEEFTWRVGDRGYSDVLARLIPAGVTFDLDVNTMTLHAYVDADVGTDRSSATFAAGKVRFQEATNLAVNGDLGRRDNRGQPDTYITVLGDGGVYGDATLAGPYVREGFMQVSGATTEAVLDAIGDDELARQRLVSDALGFETLWAVETAGQTFADLELLGRYVPKRHYWKGDLVTVDMVAGEFAYNEEELRVYGTLISERDGRQETPGEPVTAGWRSALDLGSAYKVPPPIDSVPGDGGSGGSASGGGSAPGTTVVTSIPLTVSDGEDVHIPRVTKIIAEGVTSPAPGVALIPANPSGEGFSGLVEDLETDETGTSKRLAPDGDGGVEWVVSQADAHRTDPEFLLPPWVNPTGSGQITPAPGGRVTIDSGGGYKQSPSMCLARGVLHLFNRDGTDHLVTLDGVVKHRRSLDGGQTFGAVTTIHNPASDAGVGAAFATQAGRLVILVNETAAGPTWSLWAKHSDDGGLSWSAAAEIADTGMDIPAAAQSIAELPNGTLVASIHGKIGSGDAFYSAGTIVSTDGGETWSPGAVIANGVTDARNYEEPVIAFLTSGRVVALIRSTTTSHTYRSVSTDLGETWGATTDVLTMTGRPDFVEFYPGALMAIGRELTNGYGRYATSWDEGATWTALADLDSATTPILQYSAPVRLAWGVVALAYSDGTFLGTDADLYLRWFFDGHGMDAVGVLRAAGLIAPIGELTTAETDTTLVLKPDGAGGVEFGTASGDPTADAFAWMPLTSVEAGEPVLVWDGDDSLIPTLVPL